jgi:hypothetical protein
LSVTSASFTRFLPPPRFQTPFLTTSNPKMPNRALSERVKKLNRSRAKEAKMREAVAAYRNEQGLDVRARKGVRKIAEEFGIGPQWRTIINRYNGGRSLREAHEDLQKLTPSEEAVVVAFVSESADRGFPASLRNLEQYANLVRQSRLGPACEPVGESWVARFLDRHRDVLQTHWSRPLDTQRARALNPDTKGRWFELVEEFVVKAGIRPEDIYGMDESGFPPSDQGVRRVVGRRGTKTQHAQGGANRENVTALVTICADGTTTRPMIIFKAQNFQARWRNNNVAEAS